MNRNYNKVTLFLLLIRYIEIDVFHGVNNNSVSYFFLFLSRYSGLSNYCVDLVLHFSYEKRKPITTLSHLKVLRSVISLLRYDTSSKMANMSITRLQRRTQKNNILRLVSKKNFNLVIKVCGLRTLKIL